LGKIKTKILPLGEWTNAEDYHQKYYLRRYDDLMANVGLTGDIDLLVSTVAAKLISLVHGISTKDKANFEKEIEDGLPELEGKVKERDHLLQYVKSYGTGGKKKMYCMG